jgi:lysophospholipase L1-like esterase
VTSRRSAGGRRGAVAAGSVVLLVVVAVLAVVWRLSPRADEGRPPLSSIRSLAVIGDSYSKGSPMGGLGEKGWPALVADHYDATVLSTAATGRGYVNPGKRNPGQTFPQQAREVVSRWHGDVLVVFGSRNDSSRRFTGDVERTARRTLLYLSDHLPDTRIVVIGPLWPTEFPPGGDPEGNRAGVRAAAESVPGVAYVDPMEQPWFSERNASLVGADQGHFTDAGHRYLSRRIIAVLEETVLDR